MSEIRGLSLRLAVAPTAYLVSGDGLRLIADGGISQVVDLRTRNWLMAEFL